MDVVGARRTHMMRLLARWSGIVNGLASQCDLKCHFADAPRGAFGYPSSRFRHLALRRIGDPLLLDILCTRLKWTMQPIRTRRTKHSVFSRTIVISTLRPDEPETALTGRMLA